MAQRLPPPPPPLFHSIHVLVLHYQRVIPCCFSSYVFPRSSGSSSIELHPSCDLTYPPGSGPAHPSRYVCCTTDHISRHHLPQVSTALHNSTTFINQLLTVSYLVIPLSSLDSFSLPRGDPTPTSYSFFVHLDMFVNHEYVSYQLR